MCGRLHGRALSLACAARQLCVHGYVCFSLCGLLPCLSFQEGRKGSWVSAHDFSKFVQVATPPATPTTTAVVAPVAAPVVPVAAPVVPVPPPVATPPVVPTAVPTVDEEEEEEEEKKVRCTNPLPRVLQSLLLQTGQKPET